MQFISFNYNFEDFFPNEDNECELYNNYRKTFEHDNEFALIALENKEGIFKRDFLLRVDSFSRAIEKLPYVERVISPTSMKTIVIGGITPIKTPILHIQQEDLYQQDSALIFESPYLLGSFFSKNAQSITIFIKTKDEMKKRECDVLCAGVEGLLKKHKFNQSHYAGKIFAQNVYLKNLQKEFLLFITLSFLVVVIVLWLTFKSWQGIVFPVLVVIVSVIYTLGIMQILGKQIDILSTMLPTMIFITGMSDVVHFYSKYLEENTHGKLKEGNYRLILKEVGFPTFLTLITTVVGFLSLSFSSIKPIRDFGIYTSIGITIAFLLTYTLLPAMLFFYSPKKTNVFSSKNIFSNNFMRKGLFWVFRNQKLILVITAIVTVISVIGISKIRVNNLLLEDLSNKVKLKQDFNFFDENYSGARPLEILITVNDPNKNVWNYEILGEVDKLNSYIQKEYKAGFLFSLPTLIKTIYKNSGLISSNEFPKKTEFNEIIEILKNNKSNKELKRLISKNVMQTRISAKIKDAGSAIVTEQNKALLNFVERNINQKLISINITGAAHLVDKNNEYMVSNMTQGFVFSLIVIALLTFVLHRNWRMVLVFFLPNIIPLLIISGLMGFAGIELKASTSLIFSIAFGIATDDTIHFISRLKIELGYGKSLLYAFKRTYFETGKPIILTTFILLGGFMSLMLSDFQSTFYFGFLICITIFIAVLADIFLLPVLLFLIYKKRNAN